MLAAGQRVADLEGTLRKTFEGQSEIRGTPNWNHTPVWSEEVARFMFVWMTMLASAGSIAAL
jgi:hypothetical protein